MELTITLSGAATLTDGAFTNKTTVEGLTAADATNSLTLGTKAADAGLATVTGGSGDDTVNASTFDGSLTVTTGSGSDDTITLVQPDRSLLSMVLMSLTLVIPSLVPVLLTLSNLQMTVND